MRRRKSESKIIKIQEEARWQPADDLKLKTALEQVNDINLVHQAITFSSYFTSNELESRWNELLFNKRKSSESNPSTKVRCVFPIFGSNDNQEDALNFILLIIVVQKYHFLHNTKYHYFQTTEELVLCVSLPYSLRMKLQNYKKSDFLKSLPKSFSRKFY